MWPKFALPFDASASIIDINGSPHFWILGGRYTKGGHQFKSTSDSIYYDLNNWKSWVQNGMQISNVLTSPGNKKGPKLPFKRYNHCTVRFNKTWLYVIGGFDDSKQFQSDVFSYDSIIRRWNVSHHGTIPCKINFTNIEGYQSNCALIVSLQILKVLQVLEGIWLPLFTCSARVGQQLMRIVVIFLILVVVGTKLYYLWHCGF